MSYAIFYRPLNASHGSKINQGIVANNNEISSFAHLYGSYFVSQSVNFGDSINRLRDFRSDRERKQGIEPDT